MSTPGVPLEYPWSTLKSTPGVPLRVPLEYPCEYPWSTPCRRRSTATACEYPCEYPWSTLLSACGYPWSFAGASLQLLDMEYPKIVVIRASCRHTEYSFDTAAGAVKGAKSDGLRRCGRGTRTHARVAGVGVLVGYFLGTHRVLVGYSLRTRCVLVAYSLGVSGVLLRVLYQCTEGTLAVPAGAL